MIRTLVAGAVAAVGMVGLAQPAAAESYFGKPAYEPGYAKTRHNGDSTVVRAGDLNLANEAGAAALERRLRRAAVQVCGGSYYGMSLAYRSAHRACVRDALENALAQVDAPLVLARFDDIRRYNGFVTAAVGDTPSPLR